jgi:gliding motility associated protien GldN
MKKKIIISSALCVALTVCVSTLRAQDDPSGEPAVAAGEQPVAEDLQSGGDAPKGNAEDKSSIVMDGIFRKDLIASRAPIPYPRIREADVIWKKRIWRVVSLTERVNYPLYYPTKEFLARKSLIQTLVLAIRDGEIRAYNPDTDDEFTDLLTADDITKRFDAVDRSEKRMKMDGTGDTMVTIRGEYRWAEVLEIGIKEDWFFDKHYSKMFTRIVGICPIRVFDKTGGAEDAAPAESEESATPEIVELSKKELFWIHYDEARPVLARTPAYMPNNDATTLSYDDIFNMRRFSSYIRKESNVHDDRSIGDYTTTGYDAMLESEKIKENIVSWEHDLWEY